MAWMTAGEINVFVEQLQWNISLFHKGLGLGKWAEVDEQVF